MMISILLYSVRELESAYQRPFQNILRWACDDSYNISLAIVVVHRYHLECLCPPCCIDEKRMRSADNLYQVVCFRLEMIIG